VDVIQYQSSELGEGRLLGYPRLFCNRSRMAGRHDIYFPGAGPTSFPREMIGAMRFFLGVLSITHGAVAAFLGQKLWPLVVGLVLIALPTLQGWAFARSSNAMLLVFIFTIYPVACLVYLVYAIVKHRKSNS